MKFDFKILAYLVRKLGGIMYFFLSAGLGNKLTGIEHAILKRKEVFDLLSVESKILTINFNKDYIECLNKYAVGQDKFINIYDDYQGLIYSEKKENTLELFLSKIAGEIRIEKIEKTNDCKVYVDELYLFYIHMSLDHKILYVNFFDANRNKVKRNVYNICGFLSQTIILENNKKKIVQYHDKAEEVVVEEFYDLEQNLNLIIVKNGGKFEYYKNKELWVKSWLGQVFDRYSNVVVYTDKNRLYNHLLLDMTKKNFKLVSVLHSVHVKRPTEIDDGILNSNYKVCLENTDKFDGYIVSTKEQKKDLQKRFGDQLKIWVIPPTHVLSQEVSKVDLGGDFNVISVGRYYIEKRIDHIILAVQKLKNKYPSINLNLYGFGDSRDNFAYEKKIRKLVIDEKLQNNVHFKGYVDNIKEKISQAHVSVVTSTIEGFCIGILDSLEVGTPVVSYDIKYGPSEMIENGKSGYLVDEGDIQQLANMIEKVYLNTNMAASAFEKAQEFSIEFQKSKWLKHILELSNV